MKVCLLNDSFPPVIDGVANVVLNYAGIMQGQGMADVVVGTPEYPGTDYSGYPYKVIPYHSFDTTKIVKGYRAGNPMSVSEVADLSAFKPDIIHTHCPIVSTVMARSVRNVTEAPVVFTYHTKFDEDIARAVKNKTIQKGAIKVIVNNIEACDEVWVVSRGAGENLKSLGYQGEYRVMDNGVDFARGLVDQKTVAEVTAGYDLPDGVPVFLFVGRIISYKGIPIILDACRKLMDAGQDFRLVIVGSGPDEDIIKKQAEDLGLLNRKCFFTGPIYDRNVLRAWNTRADLFIFPSTYDTNGIVVREAAACGCASVLVAGSCAAEGITDDRNGFLIEQNAQSLADKLLVLCRDMSHMTEVGLRAMDEIYISWEDAVKRAHERYEQILFERRTGKFRVNVNPVADIFNDITEEIEDETRKLMHSGSAQFGTMKGNVQEVTRKVKDYWMGYVEKIKNQL